MRQGVPFQLEGESHVVFEWRIQAPVRNIVWQLLHNVT